MGREAGSVYRIRTTSLSSAGRKVAGFLARATDEYILRYIHTGVPPGTQFRRQVIRITLGSRPSRGMSTVCQIRARGRESDDRREPRAENGRLSAERRGEVNWSSGRVVNWWGITAGTESEGTSAEGSERVEGPRAVSRARSTERRAPDPRGDFNRCPCRTSLSAALVAGGRPTSRGRLLPR